MENIQRYVLYIILGNLIATILLAGYFFYTKTRDEQAINTQGTVLMQVVDFLNKAIAASTSTPAK